MGQTPKQKQDAMARERIGLKYKKLEESEVPNARDLGLFVTHDAMETLSTVLGNTVKRMVKEAIAEYMHEFVLGMVEGQMQKLDAQDIAKAVIEEHIHPPKPEKIAVPPAQDISVNSKPLVVKGTRAAWTPEEDAVIRSCIIDAPTFKEGVTLAYAEMTTGRGASAIRNRWYTHIKPQLDVEAMERDADEEIARFDN